MITVLTSSTIPHMMAPCSRRVFKYRSYGRTGIVVLGILLLAAWENLDGWYGLNGQRACFVGISLYIIELKYCNNFVFLMHKDVWWH